MPNQTTKTERYLMTISLQVVDRGELFAAAMRAGIGEVPDDEPYAQWALDWLVGLGLGVRQGVEIQTCTVAPLDEEYDPMAADP